MVITKKTSKKWYAYIAEDVTACEKTLKEEIKRVVSLESLRKKEVDRYSDKYTSARPTNLEKVRRLISIELLPDDLRKVFEDV